MEKKESFVQENEVVIILFFRNNFTIAKSIFKIKTIKYQQQKYQI